MEFKPIVAVTIGREDAQNAARELKIPESGHISVAAETLGAMALAQEVLLNNGQDPTMCSGVAFSTRDGNWHIQFEGRVQNVRPPALAKLGPD